MTNIHPFSAETSRELGVPMFVIVHCKLISFSPRQQTEQLVQVGEETALLGEASAGGGEAAPGGFCSAWCRAAAKVVDVAVDPLGVDPLHAPERDLR